MKQNKNNEKVKDYYIGLDPGSASSGWAVTDFNYNLLKFKGKDMWGVRLFNEAETAESRRIARGQRRRLNRRKIRLNQLELIFNNEISKIDPNFFRRLHDSNLWQEDKNDNTCKYSLFYDSNYTDKDYLRDYETIYHLRSELVNSKEPHDIRLVYLAIHHILKSRGHFLYMSSGDEHQKTIDEALEELKNVLNELLEIEFDPLNKDEFKKSLLKRDGVTVKKEELKKAYGEYDKDKKQLTAILDLLAGGTVSFEKLFNDENYKDIDIKSISLKDDLEEKYDILSNDLDDEQLEAIVSLKEVYDVARLSQMLNEEKYISDAKKKLYEKNKKDLEILKKYAKKHCTKEDYDYIFLKKGMVENWNSNIKYDIYLAPSITNKNKKGLVKKQKDFCGLLKKKLPLLNEEKDDELKRIYLEIDSGEFLTKLKSTDNGLIPYQVHLKELNKILDNASNYLPFLNKVDDGVTNYEKIKSLFTFKIPYYVGPLGKDAKNSSLVKTSDERILPWNFDKVVDKKKCSEKFMKSLIGRCTYTGDLVLPKDSLIYSRYMLLNELNNLKVNGNPITLDAKALIIKKLFEDSLKSVTLKEIHKCLLANCFIKEDDEVYGTDDKIKANLKSYHDFKNILSRTHDYNMVEDIIEHVVVFGDDKKTLKEWLKKYDLQDDEVTKICRLKYKDWGRLSKYFLTAIKCEDPESHLQYSIMEQLEKKSVNLMMLLSSKYKYAEKAQEYKEAKYYTNNDSVNTMLDDFYISPSAKRSIRQTLKLVDEIVDIKKGAPTKIFVEMARDVDGKNEKKRTKTRKESLVELYESCKDQLKELDKFQYEDNNEFKNLYEKLKQEPENSLRRDKLYFYYTQFGRCMYSGEKIDLEKCLANNETYDIDHIYPQSKVDDDSLDNRVLVKTKLNRDKTDTYPIDDSIRSNMNPFWKMLRDKKLISKKKYERLVRCTELTDEELRSFAAKQLVATRQSTKAIASILKKIYPNTKIVYSKAGNVSDFRQDFLIPKFRNINDYHHAKDAYLNIVVGNVYDSKFTTNFLTNIRYEKYNIKRVFDYDVKNAWNAPTIDESKKFREHKKNKDADIHWLSGSFEVVYKCVFKNTPIISYAANGDDKGLLFKLTIQEKGKGTIPTKNHLSTDKYGGFVEPKGAYFIVVKYGKTKKQVAIRSVDLIDESLYKKDPLKYCERVLKLENPEIIVYKVYRNMIFEFNNVRYILSSKKDKGNIYFANSYQFIIDDNRAQYLKQLQKIYEASDIKNKILIDNNLITNERNIDLYKFYLNKLNNSIYSKVYDKEKEILFESYQKFANLSLFEQTKVLLNLLKMFSCKNESVDIKELTNKDKFGSIIKSIIISKYSTAFMINQSVTGLYEVKVDLLKE